MYDSWVQVETQTAARVILYLFRILGRYTRNRIRKECKSQLKQLEWYTSDILKLRWQLIGTFTTIPIDQALLLTSNKLTMRKVND